MRDELASPHLGHRGSLPRWRHRSVYRKLNLVQKGQQALGVWLVFGGPQTPLAAPWGVAIAPNNFGQFSGDLLVGNFSFQHSEINAFDPQNHQLVGTIPISVPAGHMPGGLWTLTFGGGPNDGSPTTLYFTDGIDGEAHGLFGAITSVPLVGTSTPTHSDLAHV